VHIIVADNNSTDQTASLARSSGADEVITVSGTVASIRNEAAARAPGDVIIFMDADVFPTDQWAARLPDVVTAVASERNIVTGSWVAVPPDPTWIERHWFKPLENGSNSHINSGHLIVSRALFDQMGGFDAGLRTGEDFDFSVRARSLGARVVDDSKLLVIHEGYPKRLGEFVRREVWHGTGDWRSFRTFLGSKIAILGFVIFHAHLLGLLLLLTGSVMPLLVAVVGGLGFGALASFVRYRRAALGSRLVNSWLYYVYFLARGLSPYAALLRKGGKKASGTSRH
jgi:GT2 family glycosyltransferase